LCKDYTKHIRKSWFTRGMITSQFASSANNQLNGWHPHLLPC
jgi:hypothetical protein